MSSLKHSNASGSYWGSFYMVLAAIAFTIMGILTKKSAQLFGFHEYELVFWRVQCALIVLFFQAKVLNYSLKTAYFNAHVLRGLAGTIGMFLLFYSLTHLPLSTAVTFNNTSSLFLALLSWLLLKKAPSRLAWLGLILGFIGIALILRPTWFDFGLVNAIIGLASGAIAGYAYLQVRELSLLGEPSWRIVFYFSLIATVLSALMSSIKGWTMPTLASVPYLLGIGLSAMIAQLFLTHAYKVGIPFMVASLSYLVVVLSTLYGMMYLDEQMTFLTLTGIALVIISGIITGIKNK